MNLTYRDAGVDIDAGDAFVRQIEGDAKRTGRAGNKPSLGGFGALFDLKAAGLDDPVLVAATDGVGTKLELAREAGPDHYRGLGVDLVAMCANDIVAQGALPLFFLDYLATGKLEPDSAAGIVAGIADGCIEAGAALIGGETAEMPDVYPSGGFDLAGFCVGAAERGALLDRSMPRAGDIALAVASSGIHANGFSLVRRILAEKKLAPHDPAPFDADKSLADTLLVPTRIYVQAAAPLLERRLVSSIAHITGGGLVKNPPRVFPDELSLRLDLASRDLPPVFRWLAQAGNISAHDMLLTFNCGIGLIVTTAEAHADEAMGLMSDAGYTAWPVGRLEPRGDNEPVIFDGLEDLTGALQ